MKIGGFTLVELLVVIAIIAVLMAILLPSLRLAKDQAHALVCLSNLKSLSLAWVIYADENDGRLVDGYPNHGLESWVFAPSGSSSDPIERKKEGIRQGLLFPYVKNVDVYHCPADQRKRNPHQLAFRSYSIAGGMNGEEKSNAIKRNHEVRNPSIKYVFVEESDSRGWNIGSWMVYPTGDKWIDPLAPWHNTRSTLGFADGHAEKHRWLDERTMEMNREQLFFQIHPDNPDLKYMQRGYQLKSR